MQLYLIIKSREISFTVRPLTPISMTVGQLYLDMSFTLVQVKAG